MDRAPQSTDIEGMYDLLCLGCGPAGEKAATQAAYFGHSVVVVEAQSRPGGAMVNTGTVPSKALRETALLLSAFRRCPLPGMDVLVDHGLSVPRFMARRLLVAEQEHDRIERSLDRHDIHVVAGRGRLTGPNTVSVTTPDGKERILEARHILVATGSSPVRPDNIPFEHPAVVDADGVLELPALPKSMVIVGGGVIGCEYASIFAEIDVDVTLVHPRPEILPFLDSECREQLEAAMQDKGITLCLGHGVDHVDVRDDGVVQVHIATGAVIETDALLWAAGRSPNTRGIGLEELGVLVDDRGRVDVDDHYRTAVESIYAAGDVIGFPALASTSMEQGRVAACHMFDIAFKREVAAIQPIGIYTIPGVSSVGLTEAEASERGMDVVVGRAHARNNVRSRMLGDERGILKCVFDAGSRRLVGATMVGEDATELIHVAQWALVHGDGIEAFIETCFNYPSIAELFKYSAYDALQTLASRDRAAA